MNKTKVSCASLIFQLLCKTSRATHHCPNLKQRCGPHHPSRFLSTVVCLHSFSTTSPQDDFIVHVQTKEFAFTDTHCLPYTLYRCRFIQLTISNRAMLSYKLDLFPLLLAQQMSQGHIISPSVKAAPLLITEVYLDSIKFYPTLRHFG